MSTQKNIRDDGPPQSKDSSGNRFDVLSRLGSSAPLATIVAACLTLIGVAIGHLSSTYNVEKTSDKELKLKAIDSKFAQDLELSKQRHAETMAQRTFVRDIIMKTLEKGTEIEQIKALKAYAKIQLLGEPYATALLKLPDAELPTVSPSGLYKSMDELSTLERVRYRVAVASVGLFSSAGMFCTAFLFSEDVVVVPDFCVGNTKHFDQWKFRLGYESLDHPGTHYRIKELLLMDGASHLALARLSDRPSGIRQNSRLQVRPPDADEPIFIVHHPGGGPIKISDRDCFVRTATTESLSYACKTEGGSAGAPVFAVRDGALLGMHWRGGPSGQDLREAVIGTRIAEIVASSVVSKP